MDEAGRKNLLVIAPEVPRHDWNSGDLRLYTMLRLLAPNYCIRYLPLRSRPGAEKYIKDLEGIGVQVLPLGSPLFELLRRHQFQAAILEFYHYADYFIPRIRVMQPGCRVMVDTVDVHFLREEMAGCVTGDAALLEEAAKTKQAELRVYASADVVVTVTGDDGRALTSACPGIKVRVVPNIHEIMPGAGVAPDNDLIFVGGFHHRPNVDAVTYFCQEVLPLVRLKLPQVRVLIVGSNPPEEILALADGGVTVTGFVPSTTPYLHKSRVSIAPLRIGAGMKGKIGEAMAHGVPVVTTSVGAQGMGLSHQVDVLIADEPASFARHVVHLLSDPELSLRLSSNALDHISRNFTPVRVAGKMNEVLEELDRTPVRKLSVPEKVSFLGGWACERLRGLMGA